MDANLFEGILKFFLIFTNLIWLTINVIYLNYLEKKIIVLLFLDLIMK